jgi:hypothetical protein
VNPMVATIDISIPKSPSLGVIGSAGALEEGYRHCCIPMVIFLLIPHTPSPGSIR